MQIEPLQHAARVLDDVTCAINSASNRADPSTEALDAVALVMGAREILVQLVRYLQLDPNADAARLLLADLAQDRLRLALPDMREDIRGEIGTGLAAARLMGKAASVGERDQYRNVIIHALQSAQDKLNGSTGARLN